MNQPSKDEQRNLIIAAVLSFAVIALWQMFVVQPRVEEQRAAAEAAAEAAPQQPGPLVGQLGGVQGVLPALDQEAALSRSARIEIDTPRLTGSFALTGGVIDELELKDYHVEVDPSSPLVTLLQPEGAPHAYYSVFGWQPVNGVYETPGPRTPWARERGDKLTPQTPVTLRWDNDAAGLTFRRKIEVDENYMFTITQSVENRSGDPVQIMPYGFIARHGEPQTEGFFVLHEGAIGVLGDGLVEVDYDEVNDFDCELVSPTDPEQCYAKSHGWLGFTDKYWLTALAPAQDEPVRADFQENKDQFGPIYRAEVRQPVQSIEAGATASVATHFFAGAKEIEALKDYQYFLDGAERPTSFTGRLSDFFFYNSDSRFTDAIDWGWFYFFTRPIFEILNWLYGQVGNMGVAIILLTIIVKTAAFPLAYKSYVAMSKLKKLQPEMKELQERCGDDKTRLQKEMMELYKREKANPAAGCLPILIQIPVFFSLYKVLVVTLATRHQPFFGWITDLSAPDPTSLFNLFGVLPYDVPQFLLIGIWPLLMGVTMWIQQMLNPAPADPVQEKIFALMPIMFTFMLGTFASGLVIYWTANNVYTIIQQYLIMRSQGVDVDILGNIRRQLGLTPKEEASGT